MRSGAMKLIHIYLRVLELLGRETRLGWILAVANLAIASAMFLEPILFGRIVDTLANAQGRLGELSWTTLLVLVGACGLAAGGVEAGADDAAVSVTGASRSGGGLADFSISLRMSSIGSKCA